MTSLMTDAFARVEPDQRRCHSRSNLLHPSPMHVLTAAAYFLGGATFNWVAVWLSLLPWRRASDAHWTERARRLWPVRISALTNVVVLPGLLFELDRWIWGRPPEHWILGPLSACLGAWLATSVLDRAIFPAMTFGVWLRQTGGWWILRLSGYIVLVAAMVWMPANFSWLTLLVAGGYLAFQVLAGWFFATDLLFLAGCLRPPREPLPRLVAEVANRTNVHVRRSWSMPGVVAQAYAFPVTRELAVSDRLMELCSEEEVSAILAHEIAHLREPPLVQAGRILGGLVFTPMIFITPALHRYGFWALGLFILPLILLRFSRALSRTMERRADSAASESQANDGAYAAALEKLYQSNQLPAAGVKNSTHPDLYDRLLTAGVTPSYPRPAKPKTMTWIGRAAIIAWAVLFFS